MGVIWAAKFENDIFLSYDVTERHYDVIIAAVAGFGKLKHVLEINFYGTTGGR